MNHKPKVTISIERPGKSSADTCNENGWIPGTRLAGDEGYGETIIEITAVGEENILAKQISHDGKPASFSGENNWTLACRDWRKVDQDAPWQEARAR